MNPLASLPIPKLLAKFAIPSIVGLLVSSLYNIVDQIFIGWGIGYLGNAATTVAFPFTTICLSLALLTGIGTASNFSLCLGEDRPEQSSRFVVNSFYAMAGISLLYVLIGFFALQPLLFAFGATEQSFPYAYEYAFVIMMGVPAFFCSNAMSHIIQADGSPNYSMASICIGAVINLILDPLFIFVFGWGMTGAALATILGQYVSFIICALYFRHFKSVRLAFRAPFSWPYFVQMCKLGFSPFINQLSILIVQIVLNNSLVYYGALSKYGADICIAAAGCCFKLNGLFVSIMVGLAQGTQPIVGFNYGAQSYERVKKTIKLAFIVMIILGSTVDLLFQLFPEQFLLIFGQGDSLYMEFGTLFLRTYLCMICIAGIQPISATFFTSIGQPLKGILLSFSRQIFFFVPLALLLPLWMGLNGILYACPIADFMAVVLSLILVYFEFKKMNQAQKRTAVI